MRCWQCEAKNPVWRIKCEGCRKFTAPPEILLFVGLLLFFPVVAVIQILAGLVGLNDIRASDLPPVILFFILLPLGAAAVLMSRQGWGWWLLGFLLGVLVIALNASLGVELKSGEALPAVTIWAAIIYSIVCPRWVSLRKGGRALIGIAVVVAALELALNIGDVPFVGLVLRTLLATASVALMPLAFNERTRGWFKAPDESSSAPTAQS